MPPNERHERSSTHRGRSGRAERIRDADHWQKIRTNNPLERIMREIHRRTRVVGAFPDGQSCLNLAPARLRYIAGSAWSTKRYMNMRPLYQPRGMQTGAVAWSNVRKNLDAIRLKQSPTRHVFQRSGTRPGCSNDGPARIDARFRISGVVNSFGICAALAEHDPIRPYFSRLLNPLA